jgi:hypothetical protein
MLWHNRSDAAAQGLLYPGYVHSGHFHAAVDLQRDRYRDWVAPLADQGWDRLVDHVRQWPGTSVISSELLATADAEQVARALASLSFAEVHIICTARDLDRQIPSVWQENIRNRHTETYARFLGAIRRSDPDPIGDLFWSYQDLPTVLDNWGRTLPPERVHVVTVPGRNTTVAGTLWQRFTSLIDVNPDRFTRQTQHDNQSLDAAQTELLRRVNLAMDESVGWSQYDAVVKEYLAAKVLPARGSRARITLPLSELAWVRRRAEEFVERIAAAGYHVVGDLAELTPDIVVRPDPEPTDGDLLTAAVGALADLVGRLPTNPDRDSTAERLKHALREFSEDHPPVMVLRQLYWKGKAQVSWARGVSQRRTR